VTLVRPSGAAFADGEDGLKPSHAITVKVDVELTTLARGHAALVAVADAGLGALSGVNLIVGHVVVSLSGYTYKVRTVQAQTRGSCRFI
jgi:hypothetical protein